VENFESLKIAGDKIFKIGMTTQILPAGMVGFVPK